MFHPFEELIEIRDFIAERRKAHWHPSRLDSHAFEILELRKNGATASEIQRWLRKKKRIVVALSTVTRWLDKNEKNRQS